MMAIILTYPFFFLMAMANLQNIRNHTSNSVRHNFKLKTIHQFPLKKIWLSEPKSTLLTYYYKNF